MSDRSHYGGWLGRGGATIFHALIFLMATLAAMKLTDEFRRLVWNPGHAGAVDLRNMHHWVGSWFSGAPLFQIGNAAFYPPATYLMLWPLLGWVSFETARWIWAIVSIIGLVILSLFSVRISGARTWQEKVFAALLFLSINGTGVAVGNGQLILVVLPALIGAALLIDSRNENLARDAAAGSLLTWALIKPSISLPFLWIFVFRRRHWRAVVVAVIAYAILTFASALPQKDGVSALFGAMFHRATTATALFPGTRNLHALLVTLGYGDWITFGSIVVFVGLGIWVYAFRRVDQWILIGVAALIARMWTYHRVYDDGLILMGELALWRVARLSVRKIETRIGETLLAINAFVMLCPARFLDISEYSWSGLLMWFFTSLQAGIWLFTLGFLVNFARRNRLPAEESLVGGSRV